MTIDEIKALDMEQCETRAAEISEEVKTAQESDLETLNAELDAIEERKQVIKTEKAEQRAAAAKAVAEGEGDVIAKPEVRTEDNQKMETRNSKAYIDAFANYIKTGNDEECRALLTENVEGGVVPVPEFIEGRIRTAWENDEIMRRVSKSYLKGNVKVGFEISATDAVVHVEGSDAPAEETLVLGIANMVPTTIKKWISISTEVMDMGGEEFLSYIYDELTYKIVKKAAAELIAAIEAAPATNSAGDTVPAVPVLTADVAATTAIQAEALLSSDAANPVAIMNRQTYAAFRSITTADGYPLADPFDGMEVVFSEALPAFSAAETGDTYMVIGSLENGARANFPNGEEVKFVFDEFSLAEADLVKIVGRMYAAIGVVAPNHFVKVQKSGNESE